MWKCPKCARTFKQENQAHSCGKPPTTVDEYIAAQPRPVADILSRLRETIRAAAPKAEEKIAWCMPTYRQGENLIHFAAFKQHIGIYPGDEAMRVFAARLAGYKTSKGSLQLPLNKPIDYALIAEITRWRVKQVEDGGNEA